MSKNYDFCRNNKSKSTSKSKSKCNSQNKNSPFLFVFFYSYLCLLSQEEGLQRHTLPSPLLKQYLHRRGEKKALRSEYKVAKGASLSNGRKQSNNTIKKDEAIKEWQWLVQTTNKNDKKIQIYYKIWQP